MSNAKANPFADMTDDLDAVYSPKGPVTPLKPAKKQTTRLRLIECAKCNYKLRGTLGAFDRCGIPRCPGCHRQMKLIMMEGS